jgi:hypothetical protein
MVVALPAHLSQVGNVQEVLRIHHLFVMKFVEMVLIREPFNVMMETLLMVMAVIQSVILKLVGNALTLL